MPSITWDSGDLGGSGGNGWTSYSLTSGSTLPSNAQVTSITYSVESHIGISMSYISGNFQLYAIAVSNGPYTTTQYSSSSAPTLTASIAATTYESTGSFQGGTYKIYNPTAYQRTYLDLYNCTFGSDSTKKDPFSSTTIYVKLRLNKSGNGTHLIDRIKVTVNYAIPSLNAPTNLQVGGSSSYTGTFGKFTWDAASWSGGGSGTINYKLVNSNGDDIVTGISSGYVYVPDNSYSDSLTIYVVAYSGNYSAKSDNSVKFNYRPLTKPSLTVNNVSSYTGVNALLKFSSSVVGTESSTATINYIVFAEIGSSSSTVYEGTDKSYTYTPSGLSVGTIVRFRVLAYTLVPASATSEYSDYVTYTYDNRSITVGKLSINGVQGGSYTGPTIPLSWTAASTTGLSGDITYNIYVNGSSTASTVNNLSINITDKNTIKSYSNVSIYIRATRGGFTSGNSNTVIFTYLDPDKTFAYFDGSSWKNCTIYYYTGSEWKKCDPYYFDGSNWIPCSTK